MENKIIDFIKAKTGRTEKDIINWKPYEYGRLVESLPFMEVVQIFVEFVNDCFGYLKDEDQIEEAKEKLLLSSFKVLECHVV